MTFPIASLFGQVLRPSTDSDVDATVICGVNHGVLRASQTLISDASCTTNCLAPLAKVLHRL